MLLAPLLGLAVDLASRDASEVVLWPVAAVGLGVSLLVAAAVHERSVASAG